ncbi:hypothetical protein DWV52_06900 [Ruminococcaceae bacterium AF10-16]|nr:hypothetical protein DWV52_06900 [Ruminococcaceae bacterium AF10-16]
MNSQELLEYVRRVKDLEIGVYEAQQIQDEFYQSVKAHKPRKPAEPRYLSGMIPPPPQEPDEQNAGGAAAAWFFVALAFLILGVWGTNEVEFCGLSVLNFVIAGLAAIATVGVLIDGKRRQEREEEEYQAKLQEYENNLGQYQLRLSEIESENQKKRDLYRKQLVAYSEEVADYVNRSNTERDVLFDAKWKLQAALRNLYEEGIIYPKYQNLVAVSTIYEYLASGRCDRLEGPNGAYNLYEMELRQNIVIGQLSTITEHLEQIKENQYTLYYEIQNANRNSESMLSSIGDDVKFSAYQNAATAKNVETMRYISMMKNVWNGKGF